MIDHDALYHKIFSNPEMIAGLLRDFVPAALLEGLNLDQMERVNAKLHAESGVQRDGDVVWRLPRQDGSDAYLLLMLEFQSSPDRWMPLRIMVYVGLLWQHLIKEKRITADRRLPPVLPVVLYNGDARWGSPVRLSEIIALAPDSPLWRWQPMAEYLILDEGVWPDADLARRQSLVALLFRLENARSPDQVVATVEGLLEWFGRHSGFSALKDLFAEMIGHAAAAHGSPGTAEWLVQSLLEGKMKPNLERRIGEWKQQWHLEGRDEGRVEGRLEGREEGWRAGRQDGEIDLLRRLLCQRFGTLPDWASDRLAGAEPGEVEDWTMRILDAKSLDEILRPTLPITPK